CSSDLALRLLDEVDGLRRGHAEPGDRHGRGHGEDRARPADGEPVEREAAQPEASQTGPAAGAVGDAGPDALQAVVRGDDRLRLRLQGTAEDLAVLVVRVGGHENCSRTLRSAVMPRAV